MRCALVWLFVSACPFHTTYDAHFFLTLFCLLQGVSLNLRVADTLDGKELLCYVKRSPEFIRVTGIRFTIVTSYLVGEASSVEE